MNLIKTVLIIIGLFIAVMLTLAIIGIISSIIFYALLLGVLILAGTAGYKLFIRKKFFGEKKGSIQIEEKTPIGIADLTDADRTLEEYKRRYLSK